MTSKDESLSTVKFPWKSFLVAATYEILALKNDFGSQEWFSKLRPDVIVAHPFGGYFSYTLGLWASYKLNGNHITQKRVARIFAGSTIVGLEILGGGFLGNVPDVLDVAGGVAGAFVADSSNEIRYLNRRLENSMDK